MSLHYPSFLEIVTCAGGQYLGRMPTKYDENTFIISCVEDKSIIAKAVKSGMEIQDKEILLSGLLKQKLDFNLHRLSVWKIKDYVYV